MPKKHKSRLNHPPPGSSLPYHEFMDRLSKCKGRKYFTSKCTCTAKRWLGFGDAIRQHEKSADEIKYWFGIDDDTYIEWLECGAPIAVHIALRATYDLGMSDRHFHEWRVKDGWLIAPNGRKLSIKRLSRLLNYAYRDAP